MRWNIEPHQVCGAVNRLGSEPSNIPAALLDDVVPLLPFAGRAHGPLESRERAEPRGRSRRYSLCRGRLPRGYNSATGDHGGTRGKTKTGGYEHGTGRGAPVTDAIPTAKPTAKSVENGRST
jgi:hypothetical protein